MIFDRQIQAISFFEYRLNDIFRQVIEENEYILTEILTQRQLFREGVDGKGKKIKPEYTRYTIQIKNEKRQPTTHVTLKDSGDFYASITIVANSDSFEISSNVPYDNKLFEHYEDHAPFILKIKDDLMTDFIKEYFIPKYTDFIKKELGKK